MTQRVIYIADDGEEFETEEECTAYEKCKAGFLCLMMMECIKIRMKLI